MPVFTTIGAALIGGASVGGVTAFGAGVAATALGAGAYGLSRAQQHKESKAAKAARHDADMANQKQTAQLKANQAAASSTAAQSVMAKRKAVARSRTVYTSPLGLKDEASVARKTLTGQ